MFEIIQIIFQTFQHLLQCIRIAIIKGGIRRDTRPYLVKTDIAGILLHDLVDKELTFGTRAYKRHVTLQDIPELGQLVEMMLANESAHLREPVFLLDTRAELGTCLFGINPHGPKLIDKEGLASLPDTLLLVNGRATAYLYSHKAYKENGAENYKENHREDDIEKALEKERNGRKMRRDETRAYSTEIIDTASGVDTRCISLQGLQRSDTGRVRTGLLTFHATKLMKIFQSGNNGAFSAFMNHRGNPTPSTIGY